MYLKSIKIGNLELDNNVFLAPMAGITDKSFRILCKEMGVGLTTTEMVSAKAIYYHDNKTKKLYNLDGEKRPISIQLFGSDIEAIKYATQEVDKLADIIDFNMGCPAPKIVKNGDGSNLLLHLDLLEKIVGAIRENTDKPITLKIRKGWDDDSVNAVEIAKIAEECGISALAIHGRTREQFYSGKADWDIIAEIKQAINIPVIGNGDVFEVEDAVNMLEKTKCDAIMIGRGAQGNPWIFNRINHYMKTGEILPEPTLEEKITTAIRHMNLAVAEHGDYVAVREMRKHIGWYLKGLKNSAKYRDQINKITDYKEVIAMLEEYMQHSLTQIG